MKLRRLRPFKISPQVREIFAGEEKKIAIYVPRERELLLIREMDILTWSEQANIDLYVRLFAGNKVLYVSGTVAPDVSTITYNGVPIPWSIPTEYGDTGSMYRDVSDRFPLTSGEEKEDNCAPVSGSMLHMVQQHQAIYFTVTNKGRFFRHRIRLSISGEIFVQQEE